MIGSQETFTVKLKWPAPPEPWRATFFTVYYGTHCEGDIERWCIICPKAIDVKKIVRNAFK